MATPVTLSRTITKRNGSQTEGLSPRSTPTTTCGLLETVLSVILPVGGLDTVRRPVCYVLGLPGYVDTHRRGQRPASAA